MVSKRFIVSVIIIASAVVTGWIVGSDGARAGLNLLGVIIVVPLLALILVKPYIGIYITMLSLPFDRFYAGISFGASILSLFGFFTLAAYLIQTKFVIKSRLGVTPVYLFAIGFVIWLLIANPQSAMGDRNWIFTYVQLIVLMWLAAELMTPRRQIEFMLLYALIISVPAIASLTQGRLDTTIFTTERAEGFVENANVFAMYLLVAVPFALRFLISQSTKLLTRIVLMVALALAIMGIVFSVSRTGAVALGALFVMGIVLYPKLAAGTTARQRNRNILNLIVVLVALVFIGSRLIPQQYWLILREAQRQIEEGGTADRGTFLQRLDLWELAIQDWQKSPIIGIGTDAFRDAHESVVHSMYLSVLTEQGIIGLVLFGGWLTVAIGNLIRVVYFSRDQEEVSLAATWLMVMASVLIVGITNSFHYYKVHWFVAGISMTYAIPKVSLRRAGKNEETAPALGAKVLGDTAGQTT